MSDSRAERWPRQWAAALALAGALALVQGAAVTAPPAAAQGGQPAERAGVGRPLLLVPPPGGGGVGRPVPETAAGSAPGAERQSIEGIQVRPLDAPDPNALGVAAPGGAGFGADLWAGSDAAVVVALLRRLPTDMTSPTLRDLARRLLLTNAAPAPGAAAGEGELLTLRVERLRELGDLAALRELLAVVPQRLESEAIARARVEAAWLDGDRESACRGVRNGVAGQPQSDYWAKALIACQIALGERDQAALGIDLLREQGAAENADFLAAATRALGLETERPDVERLLAAASPFSLALLGVGGVELPRGWQRTAPPMALHAVLAMPRFPLAERAAAAEVLVALAALDPARLAALYQEFDVAAQTLAAAVQIAGEGSDVQARALLFQAAQRQDLPAAQAELLELALNEAWGGPLYEAGLRVFEPILGSVRPAPELAWFAATAGRALHALGRHETAAAWRAVARQQAASVPEAAAAEVALWPYARLAGAGAEGWSLDDWLQRRPGAGAAAGQRFTLTLLLAGLGAEERPSWAELAVTGDVVAGRVDAVAPLFALSEAAAGGQTGLTLLLLLDRLGRHDLAAADPLLLGNGLSALAWLGLMPEARSLANEMARARGI